MSIIRKSSLRLYLSFEIESQMHITWSKRLHSLSSSVDTQVPFFVIENSRVYRDISMLDSEFLCRFVLIIEDVEFLVT